MFLKWKFRALNVLDFSYLDVKHLFGLPNIEISYNKNDNLKICTWFGYVPSVNFCRFLLRELRHCSASDSMKVYRQSVP